MISFESYRVFYYAAKYKNFTRAANRLSTSQPAVSHTIRTLEHQLGCRLFSRSNHGVTLTPEGKLLYAHVSAGCEQFFKGESLVSGTDALENGVVDLATTETALHCYLFGLLDRFHTHFPNVRFKLMNQVTSDAIGAVKNGLCDFAIVPSPVTVQKPLQKRAVSSFSDVLICGSQYAPLAGQTISLRQIAEYPFICVAQGTTTRTFFDEIFTAHNVAVSVDIEPASSDMIVPLAESNLGIGFVPDIIYNKNKDSHTIYKIHLSEPLPSRTINVVYDKKQQKSPAARQFLRFIKEDAGSSPAADSSEKGL